MHEMTNEKTSNENSVSNSSNNDQPQEVQEVVQAPSQQSGFFAYVTLARTRIKEFYTESRRVLKVTKKPSREEFRIIVKVSGLGTALVGLIGFLVHLAKELLF